MSRNEERVILLQIHKVLSILNKMLTYLRMQLLSKRNKNYIENIMKKINIYIVNELKIEF